MTEAEFEAHTKRVETEKDALRDCSLPGGRMSYDEAVFQAAKPALKALLAEAARFPDIPESHELFARYQAFCIEQIREIVDVALHVLFLQESPTAGRTQKTGRRLRIVSERHVYLMPRARILVERIEGKRPGRLHRQRWRGVLLRTADEMNTANWRGLARDFYRAFLGANEAI